MRQMVILSGKGGTGKTSLAASFAHLAAASPFPLRAVLADADVDAANLELLLNPEVLEKHEFVGGSTAVIDPDQCDGCGICQQVCRFDAILPPSSGDGWGYQVDSIACDGCAACFYQCPNQAVRMQPQLAGYWYHSDSRYGALFHAALLPAQENSGKLVTLVKGQARLFGLDHEAQVLMVDGPPGVGCPVISAASGADLALIVVEPSLAGIHDAQRALQTTRHFNIPTVVSINKADLYPAGTDQIKGFCLENGVEILGEVPFDDSVTESMVNGEPVTAYFPESPASRAIKNIWSSLVLLLDKN
jgi:MinD superfamily P-loop ATPase